MKLTNAQTALICRGLALLLHGGIPLAEGVCLLAREAEPDLKAVLDGLSGPLDSGASLTQAMEACGAFPAAAVGMAQVGESTGRLEEALTYLAEFYEEQADILLQIKSALAYPSFLFLLMLGVLGVLLMEVLPVFDGVYASLGSSLSGPASGLLLLGRWLKDALPALALALAAGISALLLYRYHPGFRARVNGFFLARFGDRGIPRSFHNALFARAMAMGLGSGLKEEEALEQSQAMLAQVPGAVRRCGRCRQLLEEGCCLSQALEETQLLPPVQSSLLELGLRSGSADRVMADIAQRLSQEARQKLETAVSRLEPALVLICAALVGLILLAVMLPLMDILSAIG